MPSGKRPKVWHIYEFEDRFELSEDARACRKGPLLFCREAVSNNDDSAKDYCLQLRALKRYDNHLALHGAFIALRNEAADRSRAYRGYLLNGKRAPAGIADICDVLNVKTPEARKVLKRLEAVGLIERVEMPDFDLSVNEKPGTAGSAEKSGEIRSPLKREGNGNGKGNGKKKKEVNGKQNPKPNPKPKASRTETPKGPAESPGQDQVTGKDQGQPPSQAGTTTSPTTTPPLSPTPTPTVPTEADAQGDRAAAHPPPGATEVDARGADRPTQAKGPPGSLIAGELARIGQVLDGTGPPAEPEGFEQRYSDAAKEFAAAIYEDLGLAYLRTQKARELGTFAACWTKAERAALPPPIAATLWGEARRQARKHHTSKKPRLKRPGAMFCRIWDSLLAKAGSGNL